MAEMLARGALRWLLELGWPQRRRIAGSLLLVVTGAALQVAGPLLTAAAIDLFIAPHLSASTSRLVTVMAALGLPHQGLGGLMTLTFAFLASTVTGAMLLAAQARVMMMTGQYVMRDLRAALFDHLQTMDIAWFHRTPVGRVITRLTSDVEALNEVFTSGLVDILADIFLLGGIASILFLLNWRLALVAFAVLPLMMLVSLWFRARARAIYREVRSRVAAINTHLQEHISGISVIQLCLAEAASATSFRRLDAAHRDVNIRGIFYYAVFYPTVELLTACGLAALLVAGGWWSAQGLVSLGVLVAFLQYVQRFFRPISDLAENFNVLQSSFAAVERLQGLLAISPEVVSPDRFTPAPPRSGTFAFDHVTFAYNGNHDVLRDVDFAVRPGERVAVVGHTGAGKSTLVNLLLRFYDVTSGAVSIDGLDVRHWQLRELRRRFAVVLQEIDCFAGTLRDNIRIGRAITDTAILDALDQVGAAGLLHRLDRSLDSELGERGAGLSVGERQLVSFARALVGNPEFLILDEATASVDAATEATIQTALRRVLASRTALIIAHRLATVVDCDRVLVFHAGRLAESGTHTELLRLGGLYRTLHDLQLFKEPAPTGMAPLSSTSINALSPATTTR